VGSESAWDVELEKTLAELNKVFELGSEQRVLDLLAKAGGWLLVGTCSQVLEVR
jgi:hypothetical protein